MNGIDYAVIITYLALVLIIGGYHTYKTHDINAYAVGTGRTSTFSLVATLFTTAIGAGATFGFIDQVNRSGTVYIFLCFGYAISSLLIGLLFTKKLNDFSEQLSVSSILGKIYGTPAQIISAFLGILYLLGILSVQFKALGYWFQCIGSFSYTQGLFIGSIITILYAGLGGIRSVTHTDVFQFILILITVPIICFFAFHSIGGLSELKTIPYEKLNPLAHPHFFNEYLPLFFLFCIPTLGPTMVQRLLMSNGTQQAKKSFVLFGLLEFLFFIILGLLALIICLKSSGSNSERTLNIQFSVPKGVKGLVIIGFLSICMAAADSIINTIGILFSCDLINPLVKNRLNTYSQLKLARWACVFIGLLATLACYYWDELLTFTLFRRIFWTPPLMVPVLATFLGYRSTTNRFFSAMVVGIVTYFLWSKLFTPTTGINGLFPSVIANALIFFDLKNILSRSTLKKTYPNGSPKTDQRL